MAINSLNDTLDNTRVGDPPRDNSINGSGSSQDLQNSFLRLLVAQLKNQDPTKPMENAELTSQLAQINTVHGVEKLNSTLGVIAGQINHNQSLQASTLIGHGVMIPGNTIRTGSVGGQVTSTPFGVELERAADTVTATITDNSGQVLRQLNRGNLTGGVHSFSWDGRLTDGAVAADGAYKVLLTASNGGEPVLATTLAFARVTGVTRGKEGSQLDLGLSGVTSLENVRQIL